VLLTFLQPGIQMGTSSEAAMAVARHGAREGHISGLAGTWPGWWRWRRAHRAIPHDRRQ